MSNRTPYQPFSIIKLLLDLHAIAMEEETVFANCVEKSDRARGGCCIKIKTRSPVGGPLRGGNKEKRVEISNTCSLNQYGVLSQRI